MGVIEIRGASKTYRRRRRPPQVILDDLDLDVGEGGVHGFLGPNGSGKTTTIRMLLGLVRADAGELRVLGRPVPAELGTVAREVGSLVETPLFFPRFSGRLNLWLLADSVGLSRIRVEECLETVGLRDRGDDHFRSYSLGMKQRLGIAAALLQAPRLLILDEPSNGLDPAGMREVRELVRTLGADGRTTVFLSSHLLGEIQQVCDHVTVLAAGRCVASGTVRDVLAARTRDDVELRVRSGEEGVAAHALSDEGLTFTRSATGFIVHDLPDPSVVTRVLAERQVYLCALAPVVADIESAFLELTADPAPEVGQ